MSLYNKNSPSFDFSSKTDLEEKPVAHLKYIEELGVGAFGRVILCYNEKIRKNCAVKIINKQSLKDKEIANVRDEARILSSLNHENIVKFYEVIETGKNIYLIMEIVPEGSLRSLIQKRAKEGRKFSDTEASDILRGILSALIYIHDNNILHRDLKPGNILVPSENELHKVKLADFGLSSNINSEEVGTKFLQKMCGTLLYMAPEVISNQEYSKPVDLWSCGIIMYEVLTLGKHPFKTRINQEQTYLDKFSNDLLWENENNFNE